MKSTDVRMGNLIWNEVQELPVKVNLKIMVDLSNGIDWQPIPLIQEWLLRASLLKDNGYPFNFVHGFLKQRNGIYFYKYYELEVELKYVHQLQNLYFALIGEELTFNYSFHESKRLFKSR